MFRQNLFTALRRYSSTLSTEKGKKWAGIEAVKEVIAMKPTVVGLGSGSTIVYSIEYLAKTQLAKTVVCIPTSFQTRQLILDHKLKLGSLEEFPLIDITVDGADEIDENLNAIKGGGGCLFQERLVAQASKRFILVADEKKLSKQLGSQWRKGVPVEVIPMALSSVVIILKKSFPTANIKLRMATPTDKAGPVVTDNGNLILDCDFGPIENPLLLYQEIKCISGILDVGLFCKMADTAYAGHLHQDSGNILYNK